MDNKVTKEGWSGTLSILIISQEAPAPEVDQVLSPTNALPVLALTPEAQSGALVMPVVYSDSSLHLVKLQGWAKFCTAHLPMSTALFATPLETYMLCLKQLLVKTLKTPTASTSQCSTRRFTEMQTNLEFWMTQLLRTTNKIPTLTSGASQSELLRNSRLKSATTETRRFRGKY